MSAVAIGVSTVLQNMLKPLSFMVTRQKMYVVKNELEQERISHLIAAFYSQWKKDSVNLCSILLQLVKCIHLLVESRLNVTAEESVLVLLKGFYNLVDQAVKQFANTSDCCPLQSLMQLSQIICEKLTPSIYTMIHIIEKQDNSGVHVRKQGKLIPDLIYVIEQYEARLIQINKRTKGVVNLSMYVRRSTARDFRIDSSKLKDRFSKREEEESSKRQHVE